MSKQTSRRLRRLRLLFARAGGGARRGVFLLLAGIALGGVVGAVRYFNSLLKPKSVAAHTIESRLEQFGAQVDERLRPSWEAAGAAYPPTRLLFVAYKAEKRLDVYSVEKMEGDGGGSRRDHARTAGSGVAENAPLVADNAPLRALESGVTRRFIRSYPILGASGQLGPKKKEGDRQVPEGFYGVEYLNPNSSFHLSMKIAYPNAEDRAQAALEGRTELGGDIMIHGNTGSRGCLAMGDPAAEELFVLAARAGVANVEVMISPVDFRQRGKIAEEIYGEEAFPEWVQALHRRLRSAVEQL